MDKADIVINGRAQVVDILNRLPEEHKNKILRSLKGKNSSLAHELSWQTLTFQGISQAKDEQLKVLLEYISSPIIAIAIQDQSVEIQKKFLNHISRDRAKEVFQQLKSTRAASVNIKKAQNKMVEIAIALIQKKTLTID